jgi:hypothetical protein
MREPKYQRHHPLTLLFWSRKFTIEGGMRWLCEHGHICELAERPEDVHREIVLRILDLAKAPMLAGDAYRK